MDISSLVRSIDWATVGILPQQAAANINNAGYWINGTAFTPAGNHLFSNLVNKIGMTYFDDLVAGSVYAKYTKKVDANMPFGQYLEQIHVDPAKPQDFKTGAPNGDINPYKRTEPKLTVLYNAINYDVQFPVSVNIPDVQGAFAVSNGIMSYVKKLVASLFAGADDASDTMFISLLGELATIASANVNQSITVQPITSQATALKFISDVITMVSRFRFRDSKFNSMGARQKYKPEDLVLFLRADWDANMSVQRATVYHTDFTSLGIEVDIVPDFEGILAVTADTPANPLYPVYDATTGTRTGWTLNEGSSVKYTGEVISQDTNKTVVGLLCAKKCPVVLTQFNQLSDQMNNQTFTRNYWLTQRKMFGITPFHNFVVFVTEAESVAVDGLTVASVAGTATGDTAVTVTPTKANPANTYVYKTAATVTLPNVGEIVDFAWDEWNGIADITATTGNKIAIVELDASLKAVKGGIATVTSKP